MKLSVALLAAAALLASAAPATAATPTDRKVAALQKQVSTLQRQVKALQKTTTSLRGEIFANYDEDACQATAVADTFQSTWTTIDQHQGTAWFGPQTTLNDRRSCGYIRIARPGILNPPVVSIFQTLIDWVEGT